MKIIADPETAGIETSCLAISWNLPDICQVQGCKEKAYAILCFTAEETNGDTGALNIVICKKHYEEGKAKGSIKWKFDLGSHKKQSKQQIKNETRKPESTQSAGYTHGKCGKHR